MTPVVSWRTRTNTYTASRDHRHKIVKSLWSLLCLLLGRVYVSGPRITCIRRGAARVLLSLPPHVALVLFLLLPLLSGNVLVLIPTYLSQRSVRI